jgi:dUTPase
MLLRGEEIRSLGFIHGATDLNFRSASYDVRIGEIVDPAGNVLDIYELPPQGMVRVLSEEILLIPAHIAGHALVKTSLCDQSVLAINIGLIDSLYSGPVSSALINFGKNPHVLTKGEVFLRLSFFAYLPEPGPDRPKPAERREVYVLRAKEKVLKYYAPTFLNLSKLTEIQAKAIFEKYIVQVLGGVGAFALLLAALTFFLNFGNNGTVNWLLQRSIQLQPIPAVQELQKDNEALKEQNKALSERLDKLANAISQQGPASKKKAPQ